MSLRSGQNPELTKRLNDFSTSYLDWLGKVGGSLTVAPSNIEDGLFAFEAFVAEVKNAQDFLGRLEESLGPDLKWFGITPGAVATADVRRGELLVKRLAEWEEDAQKGCPNSDVVPQIRCLNAALGE